MKLCIQLSLTIFLFTVVIENVGAQNDIVLKVDGTEMIGKVIAIGDTNINFIYQNETIEYKVPKVKIAKITFSSGRVEFYNASSSLKDHHNKVAILPFAFLKNQDDGSSAMSKKIQQETYAIFNAHKGILNFQDPMTTNRLLGKAGIGANDEQNYSMGELCDILGVEFVVQGLVSIEETSVSSYSASNTNIKTNNKKPAKTFVGKLFDNSGTNVNTSKSSTTNKNYSTTITMNVYNDKGDNIFNKNHESFWQSNDAYKVTLKFLAKRTPLYTK
ncbi:hypothetical protein SAMN04515667_2097 [Formosa sp. Hel1_31_208]|uniref:hypothetical protein n=1 Tax=Formosa sp. Hel1_31_208 TaxID=1798225 RepID=UPI00087D36C7|nr:hypothetical protein [Formosa sp. Hel1_31_208]SDS40388.1 hypothetical protein SAMN04515667_2097 [Formosa sp. Hel1_31_208]